MTIAGHELPTAPRLESMIGINLRSSVAEMGTIRLGVDPHDPSNLLQRLSNNSWWTEAAALMSIPAGAAGRGERNGWAGDAAFAAESECFDFDTGAFFSRYVSVWHYHVRIGTCFWICGCLWTGMCVCVCTLQCTAS